MADTLRLSMESKMARKTRQAARSPKPSSPAMQQRAAEEDLIAEESERQEEEAATAAKEEQKRQQEREKMAASIVESGAEGVEVDNKNQDVIDHLARQGLVSVETEQSGPGGLGVKKRAFSPLRIK